MSIEYSFVIPLYNEQYSLVELHTKILKAVKKIKTGKINRDTVFIDKYGHITMSERNKYITVSKDMF